jgi:hypothetical protein
MIDKFHDIFTRCRNDKNVKEIVANHAEGLLGTFIKIENEAISMGMNDRGVKSAFSERDVCHRTECISIIPGSCFTEVPTCNAFLSWRKTNFPHAVFRLWSAASYLFHTIIFFLRRAIPIHPEMKVKTMMNRQSKSSDTLKSAKSAALQRRTTCVSGNTSANGCSTFGRFSTGKTTPAKKNIGERNPVK